MAFAKTSALPGAQQKRREQMVSLHGDPAVSAVDPTAPTIVVPPTESVVTPPVAEVVPETETLTRSEAEALRAAAAETANARRAAELAILEADEAKARLTEAERARNDMPKVIEPLDLGFDATATEFTSAERETFDELSEAFVVKVVRRELAAAFQKFGLHVDSRIAGVEKAATTATVTVQRAAEKNFMGRVQEKIPDIAQLIGNASFKGWMKEFVPLTNLTYDQALAEAHRVENLKDVIDLFDVFRKKVGLAKASTAGYAGAIPSAAVVEPVAAVAGERFTMTERKKKSEQLRKKQITQQEFDKYKAEFDKALAEDRVDP
jgi:hypothetical protein